MVLDLIITKTDDGYNSHIPSIKGCDSWGHTEDEAIDSAIELAVFYLKLKSSKEVKIDTARREDNSKIFKLVFDR